MSEESNQHLRSLPVSELVRRIVEWRESEPLVQAEIKRLRARIAALESSLRERDAVIVKMRKALEDSKDFIQGRWPDVECNVIDDALSPAPAAKECVCPDPELHKALAEGRPIDPTKCAKDFASGCGLCGRDHPTSTHTAPGGRLL